MQLRLGVGIAVMWSLVAACGGNGGNGSPDAAADAAVIDGPTIDAPPVCNDGDPCDAGTCAGGVCCAADHACGATCCPGMTVCSFQTCVIPGAACVDAADCADGEYCEFALGEVSTIDAAVGCQGGLAPPGGRCLPRPPECPTGQDPGNPPTCLQACEYRPPTGQFMPVLKYAWGNPAAVNTADSVMMAPAVIQLDDDTCDGVVDERDIPEIVFFTFAAGNYNGNGTLHAISIIGGAVVQKWTANAGVTSPNHPGRSIAAGNIDGLPGNEIVACTTDGRVRAYRANGTQLWLSPAGTGCFMPALADLDHDGDVEVIVEGAVLDGVTGALQFAITPAFANVVVSDVTNDGNLDLVGPDRVLAANGTLIAAHNLGGSFVAVGDLDHDGTPEIVTSIFLSHKLAIWRVEAGQPGSARIVRAGIDLNGTLNPALCAVGSAGNTRGGGPPTVADFNGDARPDVALAGGVGYVIFDGAKLMDAAVADPATLLWTAVTRDCSSAQTGSSIFDFDGDGKAEVIYGDELTLRVYDGATGAVKWSTCNTNGTLAEYPLVADVDNDGQADIIAVSNSYSSFNCAGVKTAGVRIFGDANGNWVRTRRVWNQHSYHVTNVAEDGTVPMNELANHLQPRLNNFRQNIQPQGELAAPDLVVTIAPECAVGYNLVATVRNLGQASVPAGVRVDFYVGDPDNGGVLVPGSPLYTTRVLYAAEAENLVLPVDPPPGSTATVYARVDAAPMHAWHECRTGNNTSPPHSAYCGVD